MLATIPARENVPLIFAGPVFFKKQLFFSPESTSFNVNTSRFKRIGQ